MKKDISDELVFKLYSKSKREALMQLIFDSRTTIIVNFIRSSILNTPEYTAVRYTDYDKPLLINLYQKIVKNVRRNLHIHINDAFVIQILSSRKILMFY